MTVSATKKSDSDNILSYISSLPFGVYKMSEEIKGLVETSNNFGVLLLEESSLRADFSVRSSKMRERDLLAEKICDIAKSHGAKCEIKAPYPAWEYKAESHLREVMVESYKRLTGETPEIEIIHAGLECGLFSERIEGLDAVSIGPNMKEIHSFNERLEISSVERTWKFIKEVLKNL
jgi:dipeptidase D